MLNKYWTLTYIEQIILINHKAICFMDAYGPKTLMSCNLVRTLQILILFCYKQNIFKDQTFHTSLISSNIPLQTLVILSLFDDRCMTLVLMIYNNKLSLPQLHEVKEKYNHMQEPFYIDKGNIRTITRIFFIQGLVHKVISPIYRD